MVKDSERPRLLTLEEISDLLGLGPVAGHDVAAAWNQTAFRGFADDGVPGSATALAAENANWTQDTDTNFRVRFEFEETANASPPVIPSIQLQYNLNGAGWNNVNAASSVVRSFGSAHYADNDADNNDRLTTGTRTFLEGRMDEGVAGGSGVAFFSGSFNNEQGEFETCIQIRSADVSDADTVQLRLVHQTGPTPFDTYTNTPSITVNIPSGPTPSLVIPNRYRTREPNLRR